LPGATQAANHRNIILETAGDHEGRPRRILGVDRRHLDGTDVESSLGCMGRGPVSDGLGERSGALHNHQPVDPAGDGFVHDAIEVRGGRSGKGNYSRLRQVVGRSAVIPEQPPGVADQGGHRPDQSAGVGADQQVHAVEPCRVRPGCGSL
jgi:hypothetical protein